MNNLLPPCFKDICVFTSDVHCHVLTRNSSRKHLYQYFNRTSLFKNSPQQRGIKYWNSLADDVFKRLQKSLNLICSMILINLLIWSDLLPMLLLNVVLCICPVTCTLSLLWLRGGVGWGWGWGRERNKSPDFFSSSMLSSFTLFINSLFMLLILCLHFVQSLHIV